MNDRTRTLLIGTLALVAACLLFSPYGYAADDARARHPFLETLVNTEGGVTVAFGTSRNSEAAARLIYQAAREIDPTDKLVKIMPAKDFDDSHFRFTGVTNVIAVGTLADNVVLQGRNWLPTWWLDRDWYYNEYEHAVKPDEALPYQATTGFVIGGFGEWPGNENRIGYIEVDRSEYFMEWMVRSRYEEAAGGSIRNGNHPDWRKLNNVTSPTYPDDFPLRLMVTITGSGNEGVMAAAKEFVENNLLSGAVLAPGAKADDGPTMFTLPAERYAAQLPFDPPEGANGYVCQGWLLPSAFQYDGFRKDAGVDAKMMYRIKYKPDFGITNFWTTPHRRAGQFEVCVVYFNQAGDAQRAKSNLEAALAKTPGGLEGKITGLNSAVTGNVLIMESLPEPAGATILQKFLALGLDNE